jgi:uncharacterized membrane protein YhhN
MLTSPTLWALSTAIFVVALVACERTEHRLGARVTKPLASVSFIATGLFAGAFDTGPGRLVFAGLCLSAVGDVLLLWRDDKTKFLLGLVSFLAAHLTYAAAFLARGVAIPWAAGAAVLLVPTALGVWRWLSPHLARQPKMVRPVIAYVVVITAMVVLSVGALGRGATPWLAIAAVLFFVSDLGVARERFVERGFINRAIGLPTYYAAQVVFALTASTP